MAERVGIVGASGYGGAELVRLLDLHPALELQVLAAGRNAGKRVAELYPNLDGTLVFDGVELAALAELALVFLATPHGVSATIGADLVERGARIVDLSGAFRLDATEFEDWYGEPHPARELVDSAVYGLTEWVRADVVNARLVANPGCYPTAALLGLLPLADLVVPGTVVIDAKSGTSGAGRGLKEHLHHAHVHGDLAAYGAPRHRHTPEIERHLARLGGREVGPVSFTPHLVPMSRGLLATTYATLDTDSTPDDVQDALVGRYDGEPFVRVLPPGTFPHTKAVSGSNACFLSATIDERTRRVIVTSVIDNLGKGAAGQALQNANLMLGLDEGLGLTATGVYP